MSYNFRGSTNGILCIQFAEENFMARLKCSHTEKFGLLLPSHPASHRYLVPRQTF